MVEPVQTDLFAGHGTTDFAVASDGTAHVFYTIGDTSKALSYRRRSSAGIWTPVLSAMPTIVYAGPSSPSGPVVSAAIVLDGTGNPQSAYAVQVNAPGDPWVPRHATMATGTWQSTLMGISNGNSPDLAIDGADTVHVVVRTGVPARMTYAYRASGGTTWTTELIDATGRYAANIAATSDGIPHVLYYTGSEIRHAVRTGTNVWSSETMVASASAGIGGLVITPNGTLHALIVDGGQALYYRKVGAGSWTNGVIAAASSTGSRRGLAIEPSGIIHAVFLQSSTAKAHAWACIP